MKKLYTIAFLLLVTTAVFAQKGPATNSAPAATVRFYPNPAVTFINFELNVPVEKGYTIQIFSFLGRKMMTVPIVSSRTSVNISNLFKGIYVFQVLDVQNRILSSNKFQVEK